MFSLREWRGEELEFGVADYIACRESPFGVGCRRVFLDSNQALYDKRLQPRLAADNFSGFNLSKGYTNLVKDKVCHFGVEFLGLVEEFHKWRMVRVRVFEE